MEKVKKLMDAGLSIPDAIKGALGMTVSEFADQSGRPRNSMSATINGNPRAPDADVAALVATLGGTPVEWRVLLWQAAKPVIAAGASEELRLARSA